MLVAASLDAARDQALADPARSFDRQSSHRFQFQSIPALSPLLVGNPQIDYALLDNLLFREPRSLHRPVLSKVRTLASPGGNRGGQVSSNMLRSLLFGA